MTGAAAPEPPVIDAHAHVFTRAMPFTDTAWTRPDYDYPVEAYLAELDAHGVAFGVITAASLFGDYNDYSLAALAQHPRLRATVMLDPDTGPADLADLRRQGVRGVRFQLRPDAPLPDLQGYRFRRFVTRLADAGLHLELNLAGPQLAGILPALAEHRVDIVIDHFGLLRSERDMEGEGFQAVLRSIDTGRVRVKISAGFRLPAERLASYAGKLLEVAGPERLFWGSDAPFVGAEERMRFTDALETFYRIVPDAATRRRISDAALRFYFF
ncbi:amidohydrolase family protein [Hephaestia sp. GCM10023244]|uniref:amidohydrolase family protein n=1 Tax=unclassified Hephaestia TaxID=2631281 RepID=UPI0020771F3A|nr:amidohydrolase family protein [Hephaestia sp. MAHUQ-44]MCM8732291.1 amidohydrolase family protein [Hephaestia sp. MAHUQ-44]